MGHCARRRLSKAKAITLHEDGNGLAVRIAIETAAAYQADINN